MSEKVWSIACQRRVLGFHPNALRSAQTVGASAVIVLAGEVPQPDRAADAVVRFQHDSRGPFLVAVLGRDARGPMPVGGVRVVEFARGQTLGESGLADTAFADQQNFGVRVLGGSRSTSTPSNSTGVAPLLLPTWAIL